MCLCWRCSITGKLAVLWSAACSSSSSPWKAIAGKWARVTARRHTGSRSGVPWLGQDLGVLDHRQRFRVFVLSIGEAGHEATTAPASSSTWWRSPTSGPGRRRDGAPTADRACRGLVKVSGCWQASVAGVRQGSRRRGTCWQCLITVSYLASSFWKKIALC